MSIVSNINFVLHSLQFQIPVCLTLVIPMLFVQAKVLCVVPLTVLVLLHLKEMDSLVQVSLAVIKLTFVFE